MTILAARRLALTLAHRPSTMAVMRVRLLLLAFVLAVLVFAGARHDGQVGPTAHEPAVAIGQLDGPPVPEPDAPVMTSVAATKAATEQAQIVPVSPRLLRPTLGAPRAPVRQPGQPRGSAGRRSFPLLI
jgi:hypothetical protein